MIHDTGRGPRWGSGRRTPCTRPIADIEGRGAPRAGPAPSTARRLRPREASCAWLPSEARKSRWGGAAPANYSLRRRTFSPRHKCTRRGQSSGHARNRQEEIEFQNFRMHFGKLSSSCSCCQLQHLVQGQLLQRRLQGHASSCAPVLRASDAQQPQLPSSLQQQELQ